MPHGGVACDAMPCLRRAARLDAWPSIATIKGRSLGCRAMDIRLHEYLQDIFERLPDHPAKRLEELLPDRWREARQEPRERDRLSTPPLLSHS